MIIQSTQGRLCSHYLRSLRSRHRYFSSSLAGVFGSRCRRRKLTKFHQQITTSSFSHLATKIADNNVNVFIIGGGPIGLSTAYHLATSRGGDGRGIVVLEKDPTYTRASATLSAGGIRMQFSLKENIQMSLYGRDFLRDANQLLKTSTTDTDIDINFQEHGYLFLASTEKGREQMKKNNMVQIESGCTDIQLLNQNELKVKFPWLNSDDILMGSYGRAGEGWFDPWALINSLRSKCLDMGIRYIHGIPTGACRDERTGRVLSVDAELCDNRKNSNKNKIVTYNVDYVVNAAGAKCESVMNVLAGLEKKLQYPIPVKPRKRCIFFFHCSASDGVPNIAPLTIDPESLAYFRSEGSGGNGNFLCGVSPKGSADVDCYDDTSLDFPDNQLFDEIIWPALYHRVKAFGEIKVKNSWAGLYEYNVVDQNGIVDFHPELENVLMLNGFSGHGLQQSPATGRAAAELIDNNGRFQTLDLSIFGFSRFMEGGTPVFEEGIV